MRATSAKCLSFVNLQKCDESEQGLLWSRWLRCESLSVPSMNTASPPTESDFKVQLAQSIIFDSIPNAEEYFIQKR